MDSRFKKVEEKMADKKVKFVEQGSPYEPNRFRLEVGGELQSINFPFNIFEVISGAGVDPVEEVVAIINNEMRWKI